jgi:hypothetical protein
MSHTIHPILRYAASSHLRDIRQAARRRHQVRKCIFFSAVNLIELHVQSQHVAQQITTLFSI